MSKELVKSASQEVLAQLGASYPMESFGLSIQLPRLGMFSQDQITGKGKTLKVTAEAGTFYIDRQTDEKNEETGKNIWKKEELGTKISGIIYFKRYQLRMFDESTEQYTSSPIYDDHDEIIPLFCEKQEIARGTPMELKAKYQFTDKTGKVKSKLEDNRVLYVLYDDDEIYQLNLRGSSMYSLMSYEKTTNVPSVLTEMSSEPMSKGSINWNKMTFKPLRNVTPEEAERIIEEQNKLKAVIAVSKTSFSKNKDADKELDEMVENAKKSLK